MKPLKIRFNNSIAIILVLFGTPALAQVNPVYENLPVGKYAVGFKIFTLTDDSRVVKTEYKYLGEKNEGDLRRKITIHLWYPAKINTGKRTLKFDRFKQLLSSIK